MDESIAWLNQGISDWEAAELLAAGGNPSHRCHVLAKYQQTVEKAVKAIVAAFREAGVLRVEIGWRHDVERFIRDLIRLPRPSGNKSIRHFLQGLLDEPTRAGIRALDALAPRRPPPGDPLRRNTEYPFHNPARDWAYPAAESSFTEREVHRFRDLAFRIVTGAERIVSLIRRRPA